MRIPYWFFACFVSAAAAAQEDQTWIAADVHDGVVSIADALEQRWERFDTPYVRVLAADGDQVTATALRELTAFVEICLDRFDIDGAARQQLRRRPLRYLFCSRPDDVAWLTGAEADGVALPRQHLVVTHVLPHEHELVHILSDLAVAPPPWSLPRVSFANDPLLQEGLAAYLGGRYGQAPAALQQAAEFYLGRGLGDPFRLLGWSEFHTLGLDVDMRYAVGARLVAFLVARDGMASFLRLYRALSAPPLEARRRPGGAVLLQLEGHYDRSGRELMAEFAAWRRQNPPLGPRVVERPQREPDRVLALDARRIEMWEGAESWIFHVFAEAGYPDVTLRFGEEVAEPGAPHSLRAQDGMPALRFALMLRPEDVRLTDLAFDRLLTRGTMKLPDVDAPPSAFTVEIPRTQIGAIDECWMSASPRIKRE